jgi:two-component sensor histidine kinase
MDNDEELAKLRMQRAVLARFGGHALRERDLDVLLHEAASLVSDACGVEFAKVLELLPGGEALLVRAGVNWNDGVVGHARMAAHAGSPGGYALETRKAVISRNVDAEDRFAIPDLLREHGVRSMVNVTIEGERGPWGVLEVDSRVLRDFTEDDVAFLKNYANLLATAIDRHHAHAALAAAQERDRILQAELKHRGRNLLANIEALASRTLKSSPDLETFRTAFLGRLMALGRVHDLLTLGSDAISLRRLLMEELEAHGAPAERTRLAGPDIDLSPQTAQALAMGFHELATNASKYGAIAHAEGRLDVGWRRKPDEGVDMVEIRWRESGVAMAAPPQRRGMGSELVEKSLPRMLDGETEMIFHADGLEGIIRFSMPRKPEAT